MCKNTRNAHICSPLAHTHAHSKLVTKVGKVESWVTFVAFAHRHKSLNNLFILSSSPCTTSSVCLHVANRHCAGSPHLRIRPARLYFFCNGGLVFLSSEIERLACENVPMFQSHLNHFNRSLSSHFPATNLMNNKSSNYVFCFSSVVVEQLTRSYFHSFPTQTNFSNLFQCCNHFAISLCTVL